MQFGEILSALHNMISESPANSFFHETTGYSYTASPEFIMNQNKQHENAIKTHLND